ncbi:phosphotransferase [Bacillus thermocopriae]|uniref:Phosphotransferase n=1 Tax=Neobacillus thermocopriae TaxID=1215031 RepID=A0A6B3TKN8_9BACI|nr:choline/ethanolamine kinase family protein [Neobacillus thermocopriae]NEX77494.1 phosphotransferase [Neobacillus thermocopriae]
MEPTFIQLLKDAETSEAALKIAYEAVRNTEPLGSMTNKNYPLVLNGKKYVIRIPGKGTSEMINRKEEKFNSLLASEYGFYADILFFDEETGIKIVEMIPGAVTLTEEMVQKPTFMKLTAEMLKRLHQSDMPMENCFDVFEKMEQYERLMYEANGQPFDGMDEVKAQVMALKEFYQKMDIPLVPCHIDPAPQNIVMSEGKLYLLDWEYSGLNDPAWDIASHILESSLSPEEEKIFLAHYFDGEPITDEMKQRLILNKIFQDYLWTMWTIYKEAKGDDFGTYGMERLNRARKNLTDPVINELLCEMKR